MLAYRIYYNSSQRCVCWRIQLICSLHAASSLVHLRLTAMRIIRYEKRLVKNQRFHILCLDFGLRTVNVPTELMRRFIDVASLNTRQNRETCGILAGRLVRQVFTELSLLAFLTTFYYRFQSLLFRWQMIELGEKKFEPC
jgi:hypothetical protein